MANTTSNVIGLFEIIALLVVVYLIYKLYTDITHIIPPLAIEQAYVQPEQLLMLSLPSLVNFL